MDHTYFADNNNVPKFINSKSHKICSVPQCNNRTGGDRNISLHRFPKDFNALMWWTHRFKLVKVPKYGHACSDHFCDDDFISLTGSRRHLKPQAIPSRKLPAYSAQELKKQAQKENRKEWSLRKELFYQKILARPTQESVSIPDIVLPKMKSAPCVKEARPPVDRKKDVPVQVVTVTPKSLLPVDKKKDVPVEVVTVMPKLLSEGRPKIMDLIQTDGHMQICTNLTIAQFSVICGMVELFMHQSSMNRSGELETSSGILLTLMKLKENHSFIHLSFLFDVTVACCSYTFCEMIGILRQVLRKFISWPRKEEIRRHLPKQFSNWPLTRVVIDCIEIEISSSSCLKCRNSFCSHLKIKPTIKFLVGMAPSGPVTFLTDVYDGETPAKTILDECGLLKLCEPGDVIIANRGFLMDEPCQAAEKPASQPTMLGDQSQFSSQEAKNIKLVVKTEPVVTSTRPTASNTIPVPGNNRPAATNTQPLSENARSGRKIIRLAATNTKPLPKTTRLVARSMRPAATITKPLPKNTKPVPRNTAPALTNTLTLPENTGPVAASARPVPENRKPVARAEVHIKTVERIKTFEILNSPITSEIFNGIDLITNVICALVNFTTPSVQDDGHNIN